MVIQKVLCIDDDPISVMLCRKVISRAQFANQTDSANNGENALRYLQNIIETPTEIYPEIILLDLNMPIMNGWEFLENYERQFASLFSSTKIIVLSSTIDPEDVQKSEEFSTVLTFISKPITVDSLRKIEEKYISL